MGDEVSGLPEVSRTRDGTRLLGRGMSQLRRTRGRGAGTPAVAGCAAALLLTAIAAVGCSSTPSPVPAAREYLDAWAHGDDAGAAGRTDDPAAARTALASVRSGLSVRAISVTPGKASGKGDARTVAFHGVLTLTGLGDWPYDGSLA